MHGSSVEVWGKSGATIQLIGDSLVNIPFGHYAVVVLLCGSNDLVRMEWTPDKVVDDVMNLSRFVVIRCGVGRVVICEILHRLQVNRHFEVRLRD